MWVWCFSEGGRKGGREATGGGTASTHSWVVGKAIPMLCRGWQASSIVCTLQAFHVDLTLISVRFHDHKVWEGQTKHMWLAEAWRT